MTDDDLKDAARPSPDALLENANRESLGRLKIFLGAAPGVGKTYEMLMSGKARLADGVDVVIGVVETHGRRETEVLLDGFEIIPRIKVAGLPIPQYFLEMAPYGVTLIVLIYAALRLRAGQDAPKALGEPYVRQDRR